MPQSPLCPSCVGEHRVLPVCLSCHLMIPQRAPMAASLSQTGSAGNVPISERQASQHSILAVAIMGEGPWLQAGLSQNYFLGCQDWRRCRGVGIQMLPPLVPHGTAPPDERMRALCSVAGRRHPGRGGEPPLPFHWGLGLPGFGLLCHSLFSILLSLSFAILSSLRALTY